MYLKKISVVLSSTTVALAVSQAWAETIKIAFVDPLSGLMAPVGKNQMQSWKEVIETANKEQWAGPNNKFELVVYDNKLSPQESLTILKKAIDSGIRYVAQGNGSSVGIPLKEAISKHNARNPGKEVLYINYAAIDPDMTNDKCDYWHFSYDANAAMRMNGLTSYIQKDPKVKKVFLINQNYSHGMQVSRFAKEMLAKKRPDIQIVGDDFHPLAQVKDFTPYISKIKASGADTIITGNWGSDVTLLIKAGKEAGLNVKYYTFFAMSPGVPTVLGDYGVDRVKYVGYFTPNNPGFKGSELVERYKKKYNDDFFLMSSYSALSSISLAIKKAQSAEPAKVAKQLEGMNVYSFNGPVHMRKQDHQLQMPLYVSSWAKVDGKTVRFDAENTGFGWKSEAMIPAKEVTLPSSCRMVRPK